MTNNQALDWDNMGYMVTWMYQFKMFTILEKAGLFDFTPKQAQLRENYEMYQEQRKMVKRYPEMFKEVE